MRLRSDTSSGSHRVRRNVRPRSAYIPLVPPVPDALGVIPRLGGGWLPCAGPTSPASRQARCADASLEEGVAVGSIPHAEAPAIVRMPRPPHADPRGDLRILPGSRVSPGPGHGNISGPPVIIRDPRPHRAMPRFLSTREKPHDRLGEPASRSGQKMRDLAITRATGIRHGTRPRDPPCLVSSSDAVRSPTMSGTADPNAPAPTHPPSWTHEHRDRFAHHLRRAFRRAPAAPAAGPPRIVDERPCGTGDTAEQSRGQAPFCTS